MRKIISLLAFSLLTAQSAFAVDCSNEYIVIREYEGVKNAGEISKKVQAGFVPIVKKIPGFIDYFVVDEGQEKMLVVNIFKDQKGADESTAKAIEWAKANLNVSLGKPVVRSGPVTAKAKNCS